jgi:hypothetical protein
MIDQELRGTTHSWDLSGRGTTRAEDAQGTPIQSHISPSILVYEDKLRWRETPSENIIEMVAVWDRDRVPDPHREPPRVPPNQVYYTI